jgi:hypothetical protein
VLLLLVVDLLQEAVDRHEAQIKEEEEDLVLLDQEEEGHLLLSQDVDVVVEEPTTSIRMVD